MEVGMCWASFPLCVSSQHVHAEALPVVVYLHVADDCAVALFAR